MRIHPTTYLAAGIIAASLTCATLAFAGPGGFGHGDVTRAQAKGPDAVAHLADRIGNVIDRKQAKLDQLAADDRRPGKQARLERQVSFLDGLLADLGF